jgi:SAM-dependent methyltransferase
MGDSDYYDGGSHRLVTGLDHFGPVAEGYAAFRPRYPAELFATLASLVLRRRIAWDCATGNGQAAQGLAEHFASVVASDASGSQLANALGHERVSYVRARAEVAPLADESVDLVTVAQALHWFDIATFWREVRRVLTPGGVVAAWCYSLAGIDAPADEVVRRFYADVVGPYWPPERRLVETGYRTVVFPFPRLETPVFSMEAELTLDEFVGYAGTWSATVGYRAARGEDPLPKLRRDLAPDWGEPAERRVVRWPVAMLVGRRENSGAIGG